LCLEVEDNHAAPEKFIGVQTVEISL